MWFNNPGDKEIKRKSNRSVLRYWMIMKIIYVFSNYIKDRRTRGQEVNE